MNLSFVYPIYNELDNLPRLLPETQRIAEGLASDYEVVLVDDGSSDGSGPLIDQLAAEYPNVRAVHHGRNRGLGAAIITGFRNATRELVLYMDSDFPVGAEEANALLRELSPEVDMLIGCRLGRAEGVRREVMSWTYNRMIRWGFGLHVRDVNFAFKLIRRSLLQQMRLRSEGSFIDAELLLEASRLGARIREVGFQYHTRVAGTSTAAGSDVVARIFGEMWRYWRRRRSGAVGPARLIVSADDLGLCHSVNEGIAQAFDRGIVTSASILAAGEAFEEAAALARERPRLDLGIHLALTQQRPVSPVQDIPSLVDSRGCFPATWSGFLLRYLRGAARKEEIEVELRAQVNRVREAGLSFSHFDGHQHLHMLPGILPIVVRLAAECGVGGLRVPRQRRRQPARTGLVSRLRRRVEQSGLDLSCRLGSRLLKENGMLVPDDFRGFTEAGGWDMDTLARTIADLDGGLTELCCHPGADDGAGDSFSWGYRWEQELAALASAQVASALAESGVSLTTYRDGLTGKA